jgi:hypothetical protein
MKYANLAVGVVAVLSGSALYGELKSGYYHGDELGSIRQAARPALTADTSYAAVAYPAYTPELPPGEGFAETQSFCSLCHSLRYITMQPPLPAATWEAEVNKMTKAFGAPIPEAAAAKITKYLQANYTPDVRKQ